MAQGEFHVPKQMLRAILPNALCLPAIQAHEPACVAGKLAQQRGEGVALFLRVQHISAQHSIPEEAFRQGEPLLLQRMQQLFSIMNDDLP